jgi:hypothetical protein
LSSTHASAPPNTVPSQNEPLMIRSTLPLTRAGISSSMAELMAAAAGPAARDARLDRAGLDAVAHAAAVQVEASPESKWKTW